MGMFDEIHAINISHEKFERSHNGKVFQTKELDCTLSYYVIFNDVLYLQTDNRGEQKRHARAIRLDYSGTLNIYTNIWEGDIELWIEYDLVFESGELVDVVPHEARVASDRRDLSSHRPGKPRNRVEITISVSDCDNATQDTFIARLDEKTLDAIREILDEPTATIYFPGLTSATFPHFGRPRVTMIASVVQTVQDFEPSRSGVAKLTSPHGDQMVILDEAGIFLKR